MSDGIEIDPGTRAAGPSEDENLPKRPKLDPDEEYYQLLLQAVKLGKCVFQPPTHRKMKWEDYEAAFLTSEQLKERGLWDVPDSDDEEDEGDDIGEEQCQICEKFSRHRHVNCPYQNRVPPGACVGNGVQISCGWCYIQHNEVDESGKTRAPLKCWKCGQMEFKATVKTCFQCGVRFQHWRFECPEWIKPVVKKEN